MPPYGIDAVGVAPANPAIIVVVGAAIASVAPVCPICIVVCLRVVAAGAGVSVIISYHIYLSLIHI